jgi:hypothetical protein
MKEIIGRQYNSRVGILVDDEDYEKLSRYKWTVTDRGDVNYASRSATREERANGYPNCVLMHRQILEIIWKPTILVDHRNTDGLDNRKENLRIATQSQNGANTKKRTGCSSKYKGVYWNLQQKKWTSGINYKGKRYYLGHFISEEEAATAYNKKAVELFGEFARINSMVN